MKGNKHVISASMLLLAGFFGTQSALARSPVITCDQYSAQTLEQKAEKYREAIAHASSRYDVSEHLIKAVITVETCFNPNAVGTSGERGLMQLLPSTANSLGVRNPADSWQNIQGGTKYLKQLLKRFDGNEHFAAAAYNGGPGAVSPKTGPKFRQVRRYSENVMRAYHKISKASGITATNIKPANVTEAAAKKKPATRRSRILRVRKNETLSHIAVRTGVSVRQLQRINQLRSTRIRHGQKLRY